MLNHGSYGIVPRYVRARQAELRELMDADPVHWFKVELEPRADRARAAIAGLLGCDPEGVTFMPNATFGVATVIQSLDLGAGDEIVATDQEYKATLNELERLNKRRGVVIRIAETNAPKVSDEEIVETTMAQVTDRTRLVIMSHIASNSAIVMPAAELSRRCRERGVAVLIDGAHGPGQVGIDLREMAPTYYAASGHKWLCTPKGSGFLYAEAGAREGITPLALSCRTADVRPERASYLSDFDYIGTGDFTPNLVAPDAIAHLSAQDEGGFAGLQRRNHEMVVEGARRIADRCGIALASGVDRFASMVTIILPSRSDGAAGAHYDDPIWDTLIEKWRIQVPVWGLPLTGERVVRVSAHLHNRLGDYDALAEALATELEAERVAGLHG